MLTPVLNHDPRSREKIRGAMENTRSNTRATRQRRDRMTPPMRAASANGSERANADPHWFV